MPSKKQGILLPLNVAIKTFFKDYSLEYSKGVMSINCYVLSTNLTGKLEAGSEL